MRAFVALPALVAVAAAQSEFTFSSATSTRRLTSVAQASATQTGSGSVSTGQPCAQVSSLIARSTLTNPSVDAAVAYACLKSVPISQDAASLTINSLKQMVQFQSNIAYLKKPPSGYANEAVDILAGLDDIGKKVNGSQYSNEYDFEADISSLLTKAHDGHLGFDGMAFSGAFRWRRSRQIALLSGTDGNGTPKVYAVGDYNQTGFTPSAVSKIDNKDSVQFLKDESLLNSYHDPDTRYNAMFYLQPAESFGLFVNPRFYPNANTTLTFENGTTQTYANQAVVLKPSSWSRVTDGRSFYSTFVALSTRSTTVKEKRGPHRLPMHLEHPRDVELSRRYVPATYPRPAVRHTASDVTLAGYFIDTKAGTVGILTVQTFNTEDNDSAREFQSVVQQYIAQAKSRNVAKHVIDVRTNGGGKVLLGYDMYLQFFPSQKPQLLSRYRAHQAANTLGSSISTIKLSKSSAQLYSSPFNFHSYLDKDLKAFDKWESMYGPAKFNDDTFTNNLRYNLSDPLVTSDDTYSIGVTMTGYGTRSNFTQDPFKKEDIIILSDGICASTCSLFTELMVQQSGVKTLAIGGRPQSGPMQAVGGTKGSLVLQAEYLTSLSAYVIRNFAKSTSEGNAWAQYLPNSFGINNVDATVNFQDNIRKGLEGNGIPTQFLNDSASCRIYYQSKDYLNITQLWTRAAEVAFGKNGGLDDGACVSGSVASQQAQQGQGEGNPSTSQGSAKPTSSKGAAAGAAIHGQTGWTAIAVCGFVVMSSMVFGAVLI